MNKEVGKEKQKIIMGVAIFLIGILLLCVFWFCYKYMNGINVNSISVEPNTFFCPLGEELEEDVVFELESAYEVFYQSYDYNMGTQIFNSLVSMNATVELVNEMYGVLQSGQRKNEIESIKEIIVPTNACYIGSEKKEDTVDKSFIYSLEFDLIQMEIQVYSWNKEYQLNSGKDVDEICVVMILDENVVYGKIQQSGYAWEMQIISGYRSSK